MIFVWEVFQKYNSLDSSFKRSMGTITQYPTMVICFPNNNNLTYGKQYTISKYKTFAEYQSTESKYENVLKIGQNPYPSVTLTEIYSAYLGKCVHFASTSTVIDVDTFKVITIDFQNDVEATDAIIYISSKNNALGLLMAYWADGDVLPVRLTKNTYMEYGISEEFFHYKEDLNIKCKDKEESFYDCYIPSLMKSNFSKCPTRCFPFDSGRKYPGMPPPCIPNTDENICARNHAFAHLLKSYKEQLCKRSCKINEYYGIKTFESSGSGSVFAYYYLVPKGVATQKEYLIIDFIGLVTAIGGALGLFIGFSFKGNYTDKKMNYHFLNDMIYHFTLGLIYSLTEYLQTLTCEMSNKQSSIGNVIQVKPSIH